MRAIILISAIFISKGLYSQNGAKEDRKEEKEAASFIFWIALIYAVILDLTE